MKVIEITASAQSVEEARQSAVAQLNAPEEAEVKIEIISEGKGKVLGLFGGSPAQVRAYYEVEDDKFAYVKSYVSDILKNLGVNDAEITVSVEGEDVRVNVTCAEDYGSVIGRRGETLDAIQYLVRLVINRETNEYKHVSINVGNYREKREATLRALAKKNAQKVRKYGRNVVLEPMNPYERRIIHTAIQEIDGVTSHSVGSDDERKVVITLEDGVKPLQGGYSNGRGRGNNNYRGRGRQDGGYSSGSSSNKQAEPRAPKKDFEGSLYGKIEVNK